MLFAQSNTGSLSGDINDPGGARIAGARVQAKQGETGLVFDTVSTDAGAYLFASLPVGSYTLTVEHAGFKKLTVSGIVIAIANRSSLNLNLEVGDITQSVDVTGATPLLATENSEVGTSFQPKLMQDGPLFVSGSLRNPQNFVAYMPGVNGGVAGSIGGGSTRSAEILIDGASHVQTESGGVADFGQFPSVEQFGEFRLLMNVFNAEYGRTGGGIQIFNTKSGSNQFHGQVFDFFRNDFLDAAGWGVNQRRTFPEGDTRNPKKPKVRQQEWGFAVGGPVLIPKIYNGRNRTFFYFTFNGFDQNAGAVSGTANMPTALMRQGDFSEVPGGVYDPLTTDANGVRSQFPGNRIPQERWSSVSRAIVPLLPQIIGPGQVNNAETLTRTDQVRRLWSIKGDHSITDNHRLSGYFSFTDTSITSEGPLPGVLTAGNISKQKPEVYRANYDWTVRPNFLIHLTGGFSRWQNFVELNDAVRGKDIPVQLGLKGVQQTGPSATFPQITWGNGLNNLGNFQNRSGTYHWTQHYGGSATWIKGKHEFMFGGEMRSMRTFQNPTNDASVQGVFDFQPFQTAANNGALRATTGHSFASFLLGAVDRANVTVNSPVAGVDVRYGYDALYFRDNFKITSKLTLNLGLRWDVGLSRADANGVQASFNPLGINNAAGGIKGTLIFVGEEGENRIGRKRFGDVYLHDFGPRAGLAYQWNSKTVIRSGYGISYSASNGLIGGGCFPCTFGVSASLSLPSAGFAQVFNWDSGYPVPGNLRLPNYAPDAYNGQDITYLTAADGRQARINNWSFGIQRELPGKFLLDATYVGSYTDRLNARTPVNQVDPKYLPLGSLLTRNIADPLVVAEGFVRPYPTFNGTLAQSLRPYPQFNSIGQNYSAQGSSRYNAAILKFEKRYSDLTLMAGYTFSRTLMYRGADSSNCACIRPQNIYNLAVERSLHTFDYPHILNLLWAYDLPFGRGKRFLSSSSRALNTAVGGWTLSGAHQYRSGNLLRPTLPNALAALIFNDELRPNVNSGVSRTTGIDRTSLDPNNPNTKWLNVDAFSIPPAGQFGSAAIYYNDFRNPPVFGDNVGIVKRTRITETTNFELRADISNVLNRTNFGNINVNLSVPATFGRPSAPMLGPRIIQLAGRFNF